MFLRRQDFYVYFDTIRDCYEGKGNTRIGDVTNILITIDDDWFLGILL